MGAALGAAIGAASGKPARRHRCGKRPSSRRRAGGTATI
jgi:hypothetical protein